MSTRAIATRPPRTFLALALALVVSTTGLVALAGTPAHAAAPADPLAAQCAGPGSDEFTGTEVDAELWSSSTGAAVPATVDGGDLVLTTVAENTSTVPFLQQPVPSGAWEITTTVDITPVGAYQQAGLILRENSSEWVAVTAYYSSGSRRIQLNHAGNNGGIVSVPASHGSQYWLRITSDGSQIRGSYSLDGETFLPVGATVALGSFAPTQIGPAAFRGATSSAGEIDARFGWIRWSPDAAQFAACDGPTYEICAAAGSDEFGGTALDTALWSSEINAPITTSLSGGALVMPTVAANSSAAPAPVQPVPSGPWEATVSLDIDATGSYQQAGLVLWENASEWVVLSAYNSNGSRRIQFNRAGNNGGIVSVPASHGTHYWLRMTSDGSAVTGSYSLDGETFAPVGTARSLGSFAPTGIGPTAFRGSTSTAPEVDAAFDWFRWSPDAEQLVACGHPGSGTDPDPDPVAAAEDARLAWREVLVGPEGLDAGVEPYASVLAEQTATAQAWWDELTPGAEPWADLNTGNQARALDAFRRLKALAIAWATPGTALSGDPQLRDDVIEAFDWMIANRYYDGMASTGNWWYLQIGYPLEVNDTVVVLYDEMSAAERTAAMDAVDHFSPSVTLTGANRVWKAMVVGLRGVIVGDEAKITNARDGLSSVFTTVTSGDGFHADGSFIQHGSYPYTGGYGASLLVNLADILLLLDGTPWAVVDPASANAYGWVTESYDPVMFDGLMMDSVRGREISREYNQDDVAGATTLRAMLMMAESAPAADAAAIRAIVARHLENGNGTFWTGGSLTELALGEAAAAGPTAAALEGTYPFSSMARVVHHDGDTAVAVAMSSARIATYEAINSENGKAWYTADGMTYVYDADLEQYSQDYWATVDRYRLAGTTVDTLSKSWTSGANQKPTTSYAGTAAGALGDAAATGMQLDAYGSELTADKAWFFFGDAVVAVGSGITRPAVSGTGWDGEPLRIETIVENRRIGASASLVVDGSTAGTTLGSEELHTGATWAHLDNGDSQIGYLFPDSADLHVLRELRTGSWSQINTASGTSTSRSGEYATLWLEHGTAPSAAGYQYIVLPGATAAETAALAASSDLSVLSADATVSAAENATTDAVAATFWQPGTLDRDGGAYLTVDAPLAVTTELDGDELVVTVVEPTRLLSGTVQVEVHLPGASVVSTSPGMTADISGSTILLDVDVTNARSAARTARIQLSTTP